MDRKTCAKCKVEKPVSEFYRRLNGYQSGCKPCHLEDGKAYRKEHKSELKEKHKGYYSKPEVKERRREYRSRTEIKKKAQEYDCNPVVKERRNGRMREYRKRPEVTVKIFARNYLNNALRDGRINKEPCALCGLEQAQGHHPDYNQPLLIVWLCRQCHSKLHREVGILLYKKET